MDTTEITNIVEKIRNPATRWDGLVELKNIKEITDEETLIEYCDDQLWIIRWVIIEKIGDLGISSCTEKCFEKLSDTDAHVVRNAEKALFKFFSRSIDLAIHQLDNSGERMRSCCEAYIKENLLNHIEAIEKAILTCNIVIANKLMLLVFQNEDIDSEDLFLRATQVETVRKHAIMMLALKQSTRAIPYFIHLYETGSLKRHIVESIKQMDPTIAFPILIDYLPLKESKENVKEIIIKVDKPIVPFLIDRISDERLRESIIDILKKGSLTLPIYTILEKKVEENPALEAHIRLEE
ncbi:hypothetical protein DID78_06900, partial [Candidatus Marinamargulisbacteria bacterium SCGC AG-343-D04]